MLENLAFLLDLFVFSILSIACIFLPVFEFCNQEGNEIIPSQSPENTHKRKSDFIENKLLKAMSYTMNDDIPFAYGNEYIINGIVFKENIRVDTFREFEVYKLKVDDYEETSGVSIDDDTHLELTLEPAPYGMIINSNVYLTHQQWNTLCLTEDRWRCAVCDVNCDVTEHVATTTHVKNIGRCRPLNKYDLTITRKINNNYHCGVCNILFDESLENTHYSSKTHEDKLLFAINKVSDVMDDHNIHSNNNLVKKDSYHFNAKAINNNHHDSSDSKDDRSHGEEKYDLLNVLKYTDDGDVEEPALNQGNTDDLPEVLEVDLGNEKVTVKFNSWNMLIRPMPDRFYCMACKKHGHARHTAEHCKSAEHLDRLAACPVVDEYDKYFVRQIDDKHYHCGSCNNLLLIYTMEHHTQPTNEQALLDSPAKEISTPVKTNPTKHVNEVTHDNELKILKDNIDKAIHGFEVAEAYSEAAIYETLRAANSNLEDIVISTFGSMFRISKLAFNIIYEGENYFYCGICEVSISKEYLKHHVTDMQHLCRLQGTPFIQAFNVHLFRKIRDALHCGLCNDIIQIMPEFIATHMHLEKHIVSLNRALGYVKDNTVEAKGAKESVHNGATSAEPIATTTEMSNIIAAQTQDRNEVFSIVKNGVKEGIPDELEDSFIDDFDIEEYVYVKLGHSFIKITNTSYNTLVDVGDGGKYCFVCSSLVNGELSKHVESRGHTENMENFKFVDKYNENLLRQIIDTTLYCLMCNCVTRRSPTTKHIVTEHIKGKKHIKHYEAMVKESSVANSYADCDQDVLML